MNEWMDEWMGWMDGRTDGRTDEIDLRAHEYNVKAEIYMSVSLIEGKQTNMNSSSKLPLIIRREINTNVYALIVTID